MLKFYSYYGKMSKSGMGRAAFLFLGISTLVFQNYTNNLKLLPHPKALAASFKLSLLDWGWNWDTSQVFVWGESWGIVNCSIECVFSTGLAYLQITMYCRLRSNFSHKIVTMNISNRREFWRLSDQMELLPAISF